ncbi:hypothetical protein DFJ77DRAFT_455771 [Powellomyces hirtus]|nr:hypothetical protein DFJ77DRAFT_455771 [Powellomyces hirtus]
MSLSFFRSTQSAATLGTGVSQTASKHPSGSAAPADDNDNTASQKAMHRIHHPDPLVGGDRMPSRDVVDGWFEEIMASLVPPCRNRTSIPRMPAPRPHLTQESKWELVRAYRSLKPPYQQASSVHFLPSSSAVTLHDPNPTTALAASRPGPQVAILALANACGALAAADAAYSHSAASAHVFRPALLRDLRDLRVSLSSELLAWSDSFLELGGLDYLGHLLSHIADKQHRSVEDWAVHTELLRCVRALTKQRKIVDYLERAPTVLRSLAKTLFGWWHAHHHHEDHYDWCCSGRAANVAPAADSAAPAATGSGPSTVEITVFPYSFDRDDGTKKRRKYERRDKRHPASRFAEPGPYLTTKIQPPFPARTLGLEILTAVIEHGGWDMAMLSLDAIGNSEKKPNTAPWTVAATGFKPSAATLRPWASTLMPIVLDRTHHWTGTQSRAHDVFEKLRDVRRPAYGSRIKWVTSDMIDPDVLCESSAAVAEKQEGERAAHEDEILKFLERNLDLLTAMLESHPLASGCWDGDKVLDQSGMLRIITKLRLAPHAPLVTRLDALHILGLLSRSQPRTSPTTDIIETPSNPQFVSRMFHRRTAPAPTAPTAPLSSPATANTISSGYPDITVCAPTTSASQDPQSHTSSISDTAADSDGTVSDEDWDFAGDGDPAEIVAVAQERQQFGDIHRIRRELDQLGL